MKFTFDTDLVKTDMEAENQEEAIRCMAALLKKEGCVGEGYAELVLKREKEYPTGLRTKGAVIAMPHAFDDTIQGNHVAIGILKRPVSFCNMEDIDEILQVKIIFMLAIGGAHEQLEMLKILMQMFKEEALLKAVSNLHENDKICEMLNCYVNSLQ